MKFNIIKINKVSLALSGGVDSSVAAWILKKLGYKVTCVFITAWDENDKLKNCNSYKDFKDTQKVCKLLNLKLYNINFSYEYWNKVFMPFIKELKKGNTPNPDILCNKEIKLKLFLKFSNKVLKNNFISTGHYVNKKRVTKNYDLIQGNDKKKDQSYFLYKIKQNQIKKCLFPLGKYKKKNIREIAKNINLINANKKDSTGICFIGKKKYHKFISKYIKNKPGNIIDYETKKNIGLHKGLFYYTIGQRKHLNLNLGNHKPYYVTKKKIKQNLLIVSKNKKNKFLYMKIFFIKKIYFINPKRKIKKHLKCKLKIRSQQNKKKCTIYKLKKKFKIKLKKYIFAITSGQSVVFYKKKICLGGGIII